MKKEMHMSLKYTPLITNTYSYKDNLLFRIKEFHFA